jgi:hypothetical protein
MPLSELDMMREALERSDYATTIDIIYALPARNGDERESKRARSVWHY